MIRLAMFLPAIGSVAAVAFMYQPAPVDDGCCGGDSPPTPPTKEEMMQQLRDEYDDAVTSGELEVVPGITTTEEPQIDLPNDDVRYEYETSWDKQGFGASDKLGVSTSITDVYGDITVDLDAIEADHIARELLLSDDFDLDLPPDAVWTVLVDKVTEHNGQPAYLVVASAGNNNSGSTLVPVNEMSKMVECWSIDENGTQLLDRDVIVP